MKKIKQLTFVLFIVSALAFSYPATQVFAQEGAHVSGNHISGVQCDSSPACNPASGTCCGQCDPGPACNPNDPNGIPCCSLEGNNNQHQDPMTHDMDNDDQDNDEINHDRRNDRRHKKNKRGRDRRGELREKLNECLQRERNSHQQQPRSTQHTPVPNCSGSVQQSTSANQALDEICGVIQYVLASYQYTNANPSHATILNTLNTHAWQLCHDRCGQNPYQATCVDLERSYIGLPPEN